MNYYNSNYKKRIKSMNKYGSKLEYFIYRQNFKQ